MDLTPFSPQRAINLAARGAFRTAASSPYARAAMTGYQYRKPLYRAAKFVYGRRKHLFELARKQRKQQNIAQRGGIGVNVSTGTNQKDLILNGAPVAFDSRILYANDLTAIIKATGDNEINRRQRQTIHVSGFSVKGFLKNNDRTHLLVNVAILSPKNTNSSSFTGDGFFRDYNESRDINFSTGVTGFRMHTLPVSTDKFRVLAHKRIRLGASGTDGSTGVTPTNVSPANTSMFDMWVPLKRNLVFNDDIGDECESKVFWVMWYSDALSDSAAPSIVGQMTGSVMAVTYYNEVAVPIRTARFTQGAGQKVYATI